MPACQTVFDLEKTARVKEGKQGGIVHLLFIAGLLLKQGQMLVDALGGSLPSWARFDVSSSQQERERR